VPLETSGTAVFLASAPNGVPLALTQFVKHNQVLHQRVLLVTMQIEESRASLTRIALTCTKSVRASPGHPALRLHAVSDGL